MSNFKFLQDKKEYQLFAAAAVEAEKIYYSSPAMCAVGCRKALELAVKWVYSADHSIKMPYRDNLQSLIHERFFRFALDHIKKRTGKFAGEKDAEIEKLRRQVEEMSEKLTAQKEEHQQSRRFIAEDITEWETKKRYIDLDLKELGWKLDGVDSDVREEYPVNDMAGASGKRGYVDCVLFGKDGLPLALIEAKKDEQ